MSVLGAVRRVMMQAKFNVFLGLNVIEGAAIIHMYFDFLRLLFDLASFTFISKYIRLLTKEKRISVLWASARKINETSSTDSPRRRAGEQGVHSNCCK